MLETPEERIKLLRKGLTGKMIERLYIINNNFKIIPTPVIEIIEFELQETKKMCKSHEAMAGCA